MYKKKEITIPMSNDMLEYLKKNKFEKRLKDLNKKLKGKKIVVYGAGLLFNAIIDNYDLSNLNIIAISDRKFQENTEEDYAGYKVCAPAEIKDFEPDYVLVAVVRAIDIIEYLRYVMLKNTRIIVIPFVKKGILEIIKEIWM